MAEPASCRHRRGFWKLLSSCDKSFSVFLVICFSSAATAANEKVFAWGTSPLHDHESVRESNLLRRERRATAQQTPSRSSSAATSFCRAVSACRPRRGCFAAVPDAFVRAQTNRPIASRDVPRRPHSCKLSSKTPLHPFVVQAYTVLTSGKRPLRPHGNTPAASLRESNSSLSMSIISFLACIGPTGEASCDARSRAGGNRSATT